MRCIVKCVLILSLLAGALYLFRESYFCRALLRDALVYTLQRRLPDTEIVVRELRTDFLHRLTLDGISVKKGARRVYLDRLLAEYSIGGLMNKTIDKIVANFEDGRIESKEMTGGLTGALTVGIKNGKIDSLVARLVSSAEGGRMNIGLLNNLMNYMPRGLTREQLKGALAGSGAFQYERAELEVKLVEGLYKIRLFLKGYHILEFSVSVPQELVGTILKLKET